VEVRWTEALRFEAAGERGARAVLDSAGAGGPSPMEALLMALASCMGIDVVDILEKMRVPVDGLAVRAEGDRRADPPRRFTALRLVYAVTGVPEGDHDKLQRAVDLSRDKYCSVLHTLHPDIDLSIRIEVD
jgi:putative redox protein